MQTATETQNPFACWKLPNATTAHAIVDVTGGQQIQRPEVEEMPKGFLVGAFQHPQSHAYFIKADLHVSISMENGQGMWQDVADSNPEATDFWASLQSKLQHPIEERAAFHTVSDVSEQPGEAHFLDITREAVDEITRGVFEKVVLSRNKSVPLPNGFHPFDTFEKLCRAYPKAFVSLASIPGMGTWLGASPEILISVEQARYFHTVSLAGTQSRDNFPTLQEASWNQKEIEEQAMVSRYIINCFKKIRLREFEEAGPRTVAAGSLLHLRTDYKVDMATVNFPQLGSVMLELLHPTSAVCGMPKYEALDFILHKEGYDRALYSGFLGPVNVEEDTHVFVNLRCMQLTGDRAVLYAGAGITHDSIPEKEFMETEMKMDVLGRHLR